uniref:Uncharacterized protein n=1 Tax=Takifugu rubripes TaxID=31033 RepID=A0A674N524_TAKRU
MATTISTQRGCILGNCPRTFLRTPPPSSSSRCTWTRRRARQLQYGGGSLGTVGRLSITVVQFLPSITRAWCPCPCRPPCPLLVARRRCAARRT